MKDEIIGNATIPDRAEGKIPVPTLTRIMNDAPKEINELSEEIEKIVENIRASIL